MYKFFAKKSDYLIPLVVAVFSFFVAYNNKSTGIFNHVDHKYPFDFANLFNNQIYTWNDYIYLGFNQSLSLLLNLSYTSLFTLVQKFIPDYITVNRLEYALAIFCNFYFTYLFITSIFIEKLSSKQKILILLCSSFFFTNMLGAGLYLTGGTQQVFAFSFIPLALYGLRKYSINKNHYYLFLLIPSCIFISSFNLPYGFLSILVVVLVILFFNDLASKIKIKAIFFFGVLFVSLNAYWLIPFGYSTAIAPPYNFFETVNSSSKNVFDNYLMLTSGRYTLDQLFKLAPNFNLIKKQNNEHSPFINYYNSPYIISLSYLTVILVLGCSLYFKKQRNKSSLSKLSLVVAFLFFIFLGKGSSEPFSGLYPFLVEKTVFFKMFRDPLKWMVVAYFIFIILSADILVNVKSKIIKSIIILFFISYLFPWTYNGLMGRLRAYDVPNYYFQLVNSYKKTPGISNKRAVILDSVASYTSYQFDNENLKSVSSNILRFISPLPVVDLFSNGGGLAFNHMSVFFKNLEKTDEDLDAFQKIGATHFYHQKDISNNSSYKYTSKYFDKTTFGKLDVYEIKKEYILPKIFLSGTKEQTEVLFSKVNPTKYIIRINNLKEKTYLNFLYTFDQNWGIYPRKFSQASDCTVIQENSITDKNNIIDNYGENNTTSKECASQEKSYQGDELGYLGSQGIFSESHDLLNKLFNKWTIDPDYIKQNFPKEDYKENPDGSINIDLTLYFKPQSYFYLGLIISILTLIGCLGYLACDFIGRRRKTKDIEVASDESQLP